MPWQSILLLAATVVVCTLFGCSDSPPEPRLVVDRTVQVGSGKVGETVKSTVVLGNTGDAALNVEPVRSSCGCVSVAPESAFSIPPGEQRELSVQLRIRGQKREYSETLYIKSNDGSFPLMTVDLVATVTGGLFTRPSVIDFGVVPVGSVERRGLQLLGLGGETRPSKEGIEVTSEAAWFSVEPDKSVDTASYVVVLSKDTPPGQHTPAIVVRDKNSGEEVRLLVQAHVRPLVSVTPSVLEPEQALSGQPTPFVIKRLDKKPLGRFLGFSGPPGFAVATVKQEPSSPDLACVYLRFTPPSGSPDDKPLERATFSFDTCAAYAQVPLGVFYNPKQSPHEATEEGRAP